MCIEIHRVERICKVNWSWKKRQQQQQYKSYANVPVVSFNTLWQLPLKLRTVFIFDRTKKKTVQHIQWVSYYNGRRNFTSYWEYIQNCDFCGVFLFKVIRCFKRTVNSCSIYDSWRLNIHEISSNGHFSRIIFFKIIIEMNSVSDFFSAVSHKSQSHYPT